MEVWKKIEGFDNYYISNLGNVKNISTGKILKQQNDKDNYHVIGLWKNKKGKTFKSHRLVAIHFIPNPYNKPMVNHINGIKNDNKVENLEWCTQSENMNHALKIGLKIPNKGKDCKVSKLTEEQVIEILKAKKQAGNKKYWGAKFFCKKFNIKPTCISEIVSGRNWKHIKI